MTVQKLPKGKPQPTTTVAEIAKILSDAMKRLSAVRTPIRAN